MSQLEAGDDVQGLETRKHSLYLCMRRICKIWSFLSAILVFSQWKEVFISYIFKCNIILYVCWLKNKYASDFIRPFLHERDAAALPFPPSSQTHAILKQYFLIYSIINYKKVPSPPPHPSNSSIVWSISFSAHIYHWIKYFLKNMFFFTAIY